MDGNDAQRKPSIAPTVPSFKGGEPRASGVRSTTVQSGPHRQALPDTPAKGSLPVEVGSVVNGKYRIDGVLGQGGVGVVFSAQHLELDERVALKFLKAESLEDPSIVARFAREAKAALSIKSEHVARILDVGTVQESGIPFIVMEYLEGQDFNSALKNNGAFSVLEVAEYTLQACEALAIAHSKGIVHRDIKPENLFLTSTQHSLKVVKVLDFGISKAALTGSVFRGEIPLVQTSQLMGTPLYMSPEQVRDSSSVDARSDIWSLGLVIYEMLTGTTAFNATSLTELCAAILERDVPPVRSLRPDVPEGLALAVQRCVQKDPAQRFQHIGALATALLPFAPKRARICAERAVAVLIEAGLAQPEMRVHSTMPPPSEEALEAAAIITQKVRAAQASSPAVVEAAITQSVAPRRSHVVLLVGALGAVALGVVCTLVFAHHASQPPVAASVESPAGPSAAQLLAPPTVSPEVTLAPPTVLGAGAGASATASAVPSTSVPTATPPAHVGSRAHSTPDAVASSSSGAKPAPSKKPLSDEGPDLGY
jgi:predicted Ser/Thr protein kinase